MSDTPRMGLPLIEAAQAQKHVTHNEALVILDALAHLFLSDRDLADPPSDPEEGEAWLVASPASGDWAGQEGRIAFFIDGGWRFYDPFKGLGAYVGDEQAIITYDGAEWSDFAALIAPQNLPLLGVGTTADGANPFAARLNSALFTALEVAGGGDGDIRLKVNKEGAADTASFLFQSNWSGRAEIGLCGDEDFHFKVSPDGSQWTDALTIDAANGALASQGNTLWHGGNDGAGSGLDADLLDGNEAAALANPPAASQAEAEAGIETALRSFSPLRLTQAIAALAGGGNKLAGIERDIRLLALKQAAGDGDRINMVDGIADPFTDESDVDTGASTNQTYDGGGDFYEPTAIGAAYTQENTTGSNADNMSPGQYLAQSFQVAATDRITKVKFTPHVTLSETVDISLETDSGGNPSGTLAAAGAQKTGVTLGTGGVATEVTLDTPFTPAAGTTYWLVMRNISGAVTNAWKCDNSTSRYAGGTRNSNGSKAGDYHFGIYQEPLPANMDLRSNAFTADAAPDTARLHLQVGGADAGSLSLNTDLIGYVSRDGGTTWTAAVLAQVGALADGTRIFEDDDIDLSGQPSGTAMKWRVGTANSIDIELHGVIEQWM